MEASDEGWDVVEKELWQELWRLRWKVFTSGVIELVEVEDLIRKALAHGYLELERGAQEVKQAVGKVSFNTRFEWLTSVVAGRRFPPVSVKAAGPIDCNNIYESEVPKRPAGISKMFSTTSARPDSIQQHDQIANCALVASLINIRQRAPNALRVRRLTGELMYAANLYFNGSACRLVYVDLTLISCDSQGRMLALHSSNIEDVVLERAYLMVKNSGSYDFQGSNAAVDTYFLTGYIPEITLVRQGSFQRVISLLQSGVCLVSLGTAEILKDQKLKNSHDYATVEVRANGALAIRDPLESTRALELDEQTFLDNFRFIYLNWNPQSLFAHHQIFHFRYADSTMNLFATVVIKPLFQIYNQSRRTQTVWVFMERHLDREIDEQSICLVQQVPENVLLLSNRFDGSNSGFYLLKIEAPPQTPVTLFCHSEVSANYSLHFYHISSTIKCKKANDRMLAASIDDEWNATNCYGTFSNPEFYKNPTFELSLKSKYKEHVYVDLQLLSSNSSLVNLQIYHMNDNDLSKPILFDESYVEGVYTRQMIPLLPNTPYKIICSSYHRVEVAKFKLLATMLDKFGEIKLSKSFPQFGFHKYQSLHDFSWRKGSNRIKVRFKLMASTPMHIRVFALNLKGDMFIRCNIFEDESGQTLLKNMDFQPLPKHGIVIPRFLGMGDQNMTLIIEKDGPAILLDDILMRLEIGSDFKVIIDG